MKGSRNVDKEKIPRPSEFRYSFISSFQRESFFYEFYNIVKLQRKPMYATG